MNDKPIESRPSALKAEDCIYVAGHRGMAGSAIVRCLKSKGYANIVTRTHAELDLTDQKSVHDFFHSQRIDHVVLAAAKVGGIHANNTYPADFIYQNLMISANVVGAAFHSGVRRLLYLGSSCIYPKNAPQPMKEKHLLTGLLEPTNEPYAVAKICGVKLCQSFNRQHKTLYQAVMPTNLYGPNDNFDLENSHVLPALIRKFHLAKLAQIGDWEFVGKDVQRFGPIPEDVAAGLAALSRAGGHAVPIAVSDTEAPPAVRLWGSGSPRREFLHVDDLADACVFVMQRGHEMFGPDIGEYGPPLLNVGCGEDVVIRDLALTIARIVGYEGDVVWDRSKPDGHPRKLLDVSKMTRLGWTASISLEEGVERTYAWYRER